jgi:hypothetical protein
MFYGFREANITSHLFELWDPVLQDGGNIAGAQWWCVSFYASKNMFIYLSIIPQSRDYFQDRKYLSYDNVIMVDIFRRMW